MPRYKIAITANFTAEPVAESLEFWLRELSLVGDLEFAPYNQVFQQLLDPSSLLSTNNNGLNVVLVRFEDWGNSKGVADRRLELLSQTYEEVERNVRDLAQALRSVANGSHTPHLICLGPPSKRALSDKDFYRFHSRMESYLTTELSESSNLDVITAKDLSLVYPVVDYDDPNSERLGHIPYTRTFFAALGTLLARKIYRLQNVPPKVVVLDCDQTLWKGICGEVGPRGIEIDPPRRALQEFMLAQSRAGVLLCLCSRNNEEDVLEVFRERSDMPLSLDHIVAWRINWNRKSENIVALAEELNLGLESFVFFDDDPVVCAEVRSELPEVLTLQLPREVERTSQFLAHIWALDHLKVTREDRERTALYQQNVRRERLRKDTKSFADFLESLELRVKISRMRPDQVARVAQLTHRTNQFNFTTIRRSEAEILQLCHREGFECLTTEVSDRFGDYGHVGVVLFKAVGPTLDVDTLLLSCRALGRGVEHRMLAELGEIARQRQLTQVRVSYITSKKNRPALDFLNSIGKNYREDTEYGYIFRFPGEYAASLEYDTGAVKDASEFDAAELPNVIKADNSTGEVAVSRSNLMNRIATELYEVEQVLGKIELQKADERRTRPAFVPPRDELENGLAKIWEEVLGVPNIGRADNFFDLGGDSFQAVWLFSRIEKSWSRTLSIATLLESPTLAQLAEVLRQKEGQFWSSLVAIKPHGSRPPLFCMHAAGGNVLFYRDLANHLGSDQPVYGLQARGLDRTQTNHSSVEEMAACYLEEIRTLQPAGPYYFAGSSFGGLVAFEMARQLQAMGQRVALLALFDTYGPGYPRFLLSTTSLRRKVYRVIERIQQLRITLLVLESGQRIGYLSQKVGKVRNKVKRIILWRRNEFAIKYSAATGRTLSRDMRRNQKAIRQALDTYVPKRYQGKLTLFRASHQARGAYPDPTLGWEGLATEGIETYEVQGFHGALAVEPYVHSLVEKFSPCLVAAQASTVDSALLTRRFVSGEMLPPRKGSVRHGMSIERATSSVNGEVSTEHTTSSLKDEMSEDHATSPVNGEVSTEHTTSSLRNKMPEDRATSPVRDEMFIDHRRFQDISEAP